MRRGHREENYTNRVIVLKVASGVNSMPGRAEAERLKVSKGR